MSEVRTHHVELTTEELAALKSLVDEQLGAAKMLVDLSNKLGRATGVGEPHRPTEPQRRP